MPSPDQRKDSGDRRRGSQEELFVAERVGYDCEVEERGSCFEQLRDRRHFR